jgi:chromate transporter
LKSEASVPEVLLCFLRLGLTSFGGPVAHISYFRVECVERRNWLDEASYADLVALCQFLPGPASSQVGIALGWFRAGWAGGLAAWLGFTLPSALALVAFAYGVDRLGDIAHVPWLHGLKIVAVAVVAQAVWAMAQSLCPDRARATIAVAAAVLILAFPSTAGQLGVLAAGGLLGWACLPTEAAMRTTPVRETVLHAPSRAAGLAALAAFVILLFGLPLVASQSPVLALFDVFYRTGSLVFGGGHVVLPLLRQAVVPQGWISDDAFLAGYGAAQAVPGPLFTFAAYLGAAMRPISNSWPNGWLGAIVALTGIYLPSFLLLTAALPFWDALRQRAATRSALKGLNAAVVGLLLAALYTPVWTSAIFSAADFSLALAAFLLLAVWKTAPWLVVLLGAAGATALAWI